jgi:hypothetical protein
MEANVNRLRAVFDDGQRHSEGSVRGMWSSGLVLDSEAAPQPGSMVALVVLSGGFDGERLAAKVSTVEKGTVMLDLMDLDTARWARLQALVDGKPAAMEMPVERPAKSPPPDAAVFILSGGEDELGDPTGAVTFDLDNAPPPPAAAAAAVPASPFEVPSPLDPAPALARRDTPVALDAPPHMPAVPVDSDVEDGEVDDADVEAAAVEDAALEDDEGLEAQLIELGRRNHALQEENTQLKAEVARLQTQVALKEALEEELADAMARLETIEKSLQR